MKGMGINIIEIGNRKHLSSRKYLKRNLKNLKDTARL